MAVISSWLDAMVQSCSRLDGVACLTRDMINDINYCSSWLLHQVNWSALGQYLGMTICYFRANLGKMEDKSVK